MDEESRTAVIRRRVSSAARRLGGSAADDPETIYQCVLKAYEAGANGIVVSREYEELTVPNLRAVGRAVRELGKPTNR